MKNNILKKNIFTDSIKEITQITWFPKEMLIPVALRIFLLAGIISIFVLFMDYCISKATYFLFTVNF